MFVVFETVETGLFSCFLFAGQLPTNIAFFLARVLIYGRAAVQQVIGRPLGEDTMLRVAHALEGRLKFSSLVPDRVREPRSSME